MRNLATLDLQQAKHNYSIVNGTQTLLEALWREHKPIMQLFHMRGTAKAPLPRPAKPAPKIVKRGGHDDPNFMPVVFAMLLNGVAKDFGIEPGSILSPVRSSMLSEARSVIIAILVQRGWSRKQIGDHMGGKSDKTIRSCGEKIVVYQRRNPTVAKSLARWQHMAEPKK